MRPKDNEMPVTDAEAEAKIAACPPWSRDILRSIRAMTAAVQRENERLEAEIRRVAAEQRGDSRLH
jgi:hypothetical protein